MRELQVECEALSDSMDEFRGTVERLQLSETSLQKRVRYLEMELVASKRKGEVELAALKRKIEAERVTLKRNGKASVARPEQFLHDGLCQVSTPPWTSYSLDLSTVLKDAEEIGPVSCQANIWLGCHSKIAASIGMGFGTR